jgi:hypothetical protein
LLQGAITSVCDGLGVEPDADTEEDTPGNSFVRRMAALGRLIHEKIRGGLYHGVKRAMVVVRSGFEYDMDFITDGFITDPDRTDEENEVACLNLIEAAVEPGGRLAKLEPNLGMKAHVNKLILVTFIMMALGALKHLDVILY